MAILNTCKDNLAGWSHAKFARNGGAHWGFPSNRAWLKIEIPKGFPVLVVRHFWNWNQTVDSCLQGCWLQLGTMRIMRIVVSCSWDRLIVDFTTNFQQFRSVWNWSNGIHRSGYMSSHCDDTWRPLERRSQRNHSRNSQRSPAGPCLILV